MESRNASSRPSASLASRDQPNDTTVWPNGPPPPGPRALTHQPSAISPPPIGRSSTHLDGYRRNDDTRDIRRVGHTRPRGDDFYRPDYSQPSRLLRSSGNKTQSNPSNAMISEDARALNRKATDANRNLDQLRNAIDPPADGLDDLAVSRSQQNIQKTTPNSDMRIKGITASTVGPSEHEFVIENAKAKPASKTDLPAPHCVSPSNFDKQYDDKVSNGDGFSHLAALMENNNTLPTNISRSRSPARGRAVNTPLSEITTSSTSSSMRKKCADCGKPDTSTVPLIKCHHCDRRYHRMCGDPSPGKSLTENFTCGRCLRKGRSKAASKHISEGSIATRPCQQRPSTLSHVNASSVAKTSVPVIPGLAAASLIQNSREMNIPGTRSRSSSISSIPPIGTHTEEQHLDSQRQFKAPSDQFRQDISRLKDSEDNYITARPTPAVGPTRARVSHSSAGPIIMPEAQTQSQTGHPGTNTSREPSRDFVNDVIGSHRPSETSPVWSSTQRQHLSEKPHLIYDPVIAQKAEEVRRRYKTKVMCPFFSKAGSCSFGPEFCMFAHQDAEELSPDGRTRAKAFTCPDWQENDCKFSGIACHYSHSDTGLYVGYDQKASRKHLTCFWFYENGACKFKERECLYSHIWTGIVAPDPDKRKSTSRHPGYYNPPFLPSSLSTMSVTSYSAHQSFQPEHFMVSTPVQYPVQTPYWHAPTPREYYAPEVYNLPLARAESSRKSPQPSDITSSAPRDPRLRQNSLPNVQNTNQQITNGTGNIFAPYAPANRTEAEAANNCSPGTDVGRRTSTNRCTSCGKVVFKSEFCVTCRENRPSDDSPMVNSDVNLEQVTNTATGRAGPTDLVNKLTDLQDDRYMTEPQVLADQNSARSLNKRKATETSIFPYSKRPKPDLNLATSKIEIPKPTTTLEELTERAKYTGLVTPMTVSEDDEPGPAAADAEHEFQSPEQILPYSPVSDSLAEPEQVNVTSREEDIAGENSGVEQSRTYESLRHSSAQRSAGRGFGVRDDDIAKQSEIEPDQPPARNGDYPSQVPKEIRELDDEKSSKEALYHKDEDKFQGKDFVAAVEQHAQTERSIDLTADEEDAVHLSYSPTEQTKGPLQKKSPPIIKVEPDELHFPGAGGNTRMLKLRNLSRHHYKAEFRLIASPSIDSWLEIEPSHGTILAGDTVEIYCRQHEHIVIDQNDLVSSSIRLKTRLIGTGTLPELGTVPISVKQPPQYIPVSVKPTVPHEDPSRKSVQDDLDRDLEKSSRHLDQYPGTPPASSEGSAEGTPSKVRLKLNFGSKRVEAFVPPVPPPAVEKALSTKEKHVENRVDLDNNHEVRVAETISKLKRRGVVFEDEDDEETQDEPRYHLCQTRTPPPMPTNELLLSKITKGQSLKAPDRAKRIRARQMSRNLQIYGNPSVAYERNLSSQKVHALVDRRKPTTGTTGKKRRDKFAPDEIETEKECITFQEFLGFDKNLKFEPCLSGQGPMAKLAYRARVDRNDAIGRGKTRRVKESEKWEITDR